MANIYDVCTKDFMTLIKWHIATILLLLVDSMLVITETANPNICAFLVNVLVGFTMRHKSIDDIAYRVVPGIREHECCGTNIIISNQAISIRSSSYRIVSRTAFWGTLGTDYTMLGPPQVFNLAYRGIFIETLHFLHLMQKLSFQVVHADPIWNMLWLGMGEQIAKHLAAE